MPRVLVTTTSFQDTPGTHHDLLAKTGWEIVTARGPLNEADTLAAVGEIDAYICGDDLITDAVLAKAQPRLKVISKYGIGVEMSTAGVMSMKVPTTSSSTLISSRMTMGLLDKPIMAALTSWGTRSEANTQLMA